MQTTQTIIFLHATAFRALAYIGANYLVQRIRQTGIRPLIGRRRMNAIGGSAIAALIGNRVGNGGWRRVKRAKISRFMCANVQSGCER